MRYQSLNNPNIIFILGIADYLQIYSMKKIMEKNLQKIKNLDLHLNTSS